MLDALAEHGVTGEQVRVVDFDVRPGVEKDMGGGDQWPQLRERVLAADILVFGTPTWVYRDVLYWGQDRLVFLDEALSASR